MFNGGGLMHNAKKITVEVPEALLKAAQKETGEGISETVRRGLMLLSASKAFEDILKLKGKIKFKAGIKKLKEDRE